MTFEQWRATSPGALRLEADVSSHIVEPLLRLAIGQAALSVRREYPVGRGWADFVICGLGGRPSRVIEVKKRIRRNPSLPWTQCADFIQVSQYATALGVLALLIDARQVLLIQQDATAPTHAFTRETLTPEQMVLIGEHLRPDGRRRRRMVP